MSEQIPFFWGGPAQAITSVTPEENARTLRADRWDVGEQAPAQVPCQEGLDLPSGRQGRVSRPRLVTCWQDDVLPKVWIRRCVQQWTVEVCKYGQGPPSDAGHTYHSVDKPTSGVDHPCH
eukprot:1748570-Amphidinium_carterae.1